MKRKLLAALLLAAAIQTNSNAQINTATGGATMVLPNVPATNTNVGIGTNNPSAKLDVNGEIRNSGSEIRCSTGIGMTTLNNSYGPTLSWGTGGIGFNRSRNTNGGNWTYYGDGANNGGSFIWGTVAGGINFSPMASTGGSSTTLISDATVVSKIKVRFNSDGKVLIADEGAITSLPAGYRLYVQDGILTEKLKIAIKNSANWADYVFAKNYKLKSLEEVETYININKHLPDVPSAEQIVNSGLDISQMQATQMQKIEELTLYMIEMKKQINRLEKENKQLNDIIVNYKN